MTSGEEDELSKRRALGGILIRREHWTLSLKGKCLALVIVVTLVMTAQRGAHSFLAVTNRVPAETLIVEGWTPPYTLGQAASEFRTGHFKRLVLVRSLYTVGESRELGRDYVDYLIRLLVQQGVPRECVEPVFCSVVRKDRTYHSALAVKQWLAQRAIPVTSLDVATLGPHARRSRLLYRKAFGKDVAVGVIGLEDQGYDPLHWWRSSEGVREVLGESIAYGYARLFFYPSDTDSKHQPAPVEHTP